MNYLHLGWAIFAFSSIASVTIHLAHIFAPSSPSPLAAIIGVIGTFTGVALIIHASMRAKLRIPPGGKTAVRFAGLILVGVAVWIAAIMFPVLAPIRDAASMAPFWSPAIGIAIIFGVTGLRRLMVQ